MGRGGYGDRWWNGGGFAQGLASQSPCLCSVAPSGLYGCGMGDFCAGARCARPCLDSCAPSGLYGCGVGDFCAGARCARPCLDSVAPLGLGWGGGFLCRGSLRSPLPVFCCPFGALRVWGGGFVQGLASLAPAYILAPLRGLPFTIHHSQFTIHYSPFTIHHSQFT